MWGFERRVDAILNRLKSTYPKTQFIEIHSNKELIKNLI